MCVTGSRTIFKIEAEDGVEDAAGPCLEAGVDAGAQEVANVKWPFGSRRWCW